MRSVSIIIPAHDHAGLTRACIECVRGSDAFHAEVIVIDDASPTPLTLTDAQSARVIRSDENLGFAQACNLGARHADGEVLVFLNNDASVGGRWLTTMLTALEDDVAVVGARMLYRDGTTQHAGLVFSQEDGAPRHVYRGFPGDHPAVTRSRDMQAVTGACLMIRRDDFLAEGFDSSYVNGFEDVDLCLRMRSLGMRVVYCGDTAITHLESVSIRTDATADAARHARNLARFEEKWGRSVVRDELAIYTEDGLLVIRAGDAYPLSVEIAPELGALTAGGQVPELGTLLNIRSRQVFDLEKTVGALSAQLLDHGVRPTTT